MNGASIAYGLRAALAQHEGTALHRFAVEALDAFARLSTTAHDILMSLPPEERPALITDYGETVLADAKAFAAGWAGYPNDGPADVFAPAPQLDLEPRFYTVNRFTDPDEPITTDTTAPALALVPDGHGVVHVEAMTGTRTRPDGSQVTVWGTRVYVDRRPPLGRAP